MLAQLVKDWGWCRVDGDKQPRLCVHREEHEQEEEQRFHRNEELPAQTSFVTAASLPRGLWAAFGCAGVQLLPAASWGTRES